MAPTAPTQSFYGRWATLYDAIATAPGVGNWRARAADVLALEPGDTVVEFGCGSGANLPYLRERVGPGGRVVAVDLTRPLLALARDAGRGDAHLLQGDATRPPLRGPVDAVLGSFVTGMFADPAAVVADWCDLLAPGGRIALLDAARSRSLPGRLLNPAFRLFTWASTPAGNRRLGATADLDRRVAAAREALAARTDEQTRETMALGFVRLASGTRPR